MQAENLQHVIDVLDVPELPEAEVLDLGVIGLNLESGKINTCISNSVIVKISDSSRTPLYDSPWSSKVSNWSIHLNLLL